MKNEPLKILIVEDERLVAWELEIRLKRNNFNVVGTTSSSEEAIELAKKNNPDVILMDINLKSERDGVETSQIILSSLKTFILFISANNDSITKEKIKSVQNSKLLSKPFSVHDLMSAINSFYLA